MKSPLANRQEAGKLLALKLLIHANRTDALVLALPRGGVPVAFEIAKKLNLPLDIWLVRKLGTPKRQELAMGAIAMGEIIILNDEIITWLNISKEMIDEVAARERQELQRRDRVYRGDRPLPEIANQTIILVDDGIATGSTITAAIESLRRYQPHQIIVVTPVISKSIYHQLNKQVEEIVYLIKPESIHSISAWYEDFSQTTDEEVCHLLT